MLQLVDGDDLLKLGGSEQIAKTVEELNVDYVDYGLLVERLKEVRKFLVEEQRPVDLNNFNNDRESETMSKRFFSLAKLVGLFSTL